MQPAPGGGQALRVAPGPPQWKQHQGEVGGRRQGSGGKFKFPGSVDVVVVVFGAEAAAGSRAVHGVPQVRALLRGEEARGA